MDNLTVVNNLLAVDNLLAVNSLPVDLLTADKSPAVESLAVDLLAVTTLSVDNWHWLLLIISQKLPSPANKALLPSFHFQHLPYHFIFNLQK